MKSYVIAVFAADAPTIWIMGQEPTYLTEYVIHARSVESAERKCELIAGRHFGRDVLAHCMEVI